MRNWKRQFLLETLMGVVLFFVGPTTSAAQTRQMGTRDLVTGAWLTGPYAQQQRGPASTANARNAAPPQPTLREFKGTDWGKVDPNEKNEAPDFNFDSKYRIVVSIPGPLGDNAVERLRTVQHGRNIDRGPCNVIGRYLCFGYETADFGHINGYGSGTNYHGGNYDSNSASYDAEVYGVVVRMDVFENGEPIRPLGKADTLAYAGTSYGSSSHSGRNGGGTIANGGTDNVPLSIGAGLDRSIKKLLGGTSKWRKVANFLHFDTKGQWYAGADAAVKEAFAQEPQEPEATQPQPEAQVQ